LDTQVLIIGGGATGTGLARDLALRGVECILVEKKDINAGASGANHGLLHSGARYVSSDPATAGECRDEGTLLKKLAPHCIEDTGGLFVAVRGDDEKYVADFPHFCEQAGIPTRALDVKEARELEPVLSEKLIAAYAVEDASIDPFRLSMENILQAQRLGTRLMTYTQVLAFKREGRRIVSVRVKNSKTGEETTIQADQVVNASGAWAGELAKLAGASIPVLYSKGSLLIAHDRITERVINRLRKASDADILVPGGTVSILGTTSIRIDDLRDIRPTIREMDAIVDNGAAMIPALETTRYIRAYAGVRPLIGNQGGGSDRSVSRGYALLDHAETGLENFSTITGGKLTSYRLMAEKAADMVCKRLGVSSPCLTKTQPLPSDPDCEWAEPSHSLRQWMRAHDPDDILLCECEMVPRSAIDKIITSVREQGDNPGLRGISVRSRMGKGACQGAFCGVRVLAHMYDREEFTTRQGLDNLRDFIRERWKGQRPILWDGQLIQEELTEALHCGLLGLELVNNE